MTASSLSASALKAAAYNFAEVIRHLDADALDELARVFSPEARFKDPFNDVIGRDVIVRVFAHGFRRCPKLRFLVEEMAFVPDAQVVYFYWRFCCGTPEQLTLTGVSRVVFDEFGLVIEHIDYWDPAEQVYNKVPLLGAILRWVRGRLSS